MRRLLCLAIWSTTLLAACGGGGTAPEPVSAVTIAAAAQSLVVGRTLQLSATLTSASGAALSGRDLTWNSSNSSIATVTAGGLVTALAEGTVLITASSEGRSGNLSLATRYPFPNVAGTYALTATFDAVPGAVTVGTVSLAQASRTAGALTGTASLLAVIGTSTYQLSGVRNAVVDTTGRVAFDIGAVSATTTWTFTGSLSGSSIAGRHALGSVGSAPFVGPFNMARSTALVALRVQPPASSLTTLHAALSMPAGR